MTKTAFVSRWSLLLLAILLSGCSWFGKKTGNEPMELEKFESTAKLQKAWSRGVGNGQGPGFTSLVPAIDGDNIYAVDYQGKLAVFNATSGKKVFTTKVNQPELSLWQSIKGLWSEGDSRYHLTGGVFAGHGLILVASQLGEVIALDQTNGKELWRAAVTGEVLAPPQSNGEIVVAQTINGKIFAFDAKTGKRRWFYENAAPNLTLRGTPAPVVSDTAVYAGFSNGRVIAFNSSNGVILWEQRIALPKGRSELERMVDIHASPVLQGGILYVASYQGRAMGLARGTGSIIWGQDASTAKNIAVDGSALYLSDANGAVIALNAANGTELWRNEQLLRRQLSAPQVIGDYVAVSDYKGYLHLLSQADGSFAARTKLGGKGARAPMLWHENKLYVFNNKGKLIAYRLADKK